MAAGQTATDERVVRAVRERKPYKSPELRDLGAVRDLTLSGATSRAFDPGTSKKNGG
jgi:hypothetical protein